MVSNPLYGPLELLIIQGSPFCNINCSYCYLPNRGDIRKLSLSTIDAIFSNLFSTDIVRQDFTICWHAGEPLTVNKDFYREALAIANAKNNTPYQIRNNVQTNATLITQEWCDFFKEFDFKVSVSIDGPEFINDRYRVNRKGHGTFAKTMKGIEYLKKNDIEFSVISVVTDFTLDYADDFFAFFKSLNPLSVGLNVEEVENFNVTSNLFKSENVLSRYHNFINRLFDLYYSDLSIDFYFREFAQLENFVFKKNKFMTGFGQQ
ncbi:MAG TPA: radical SAM protein, partial [Hanamia sp.]|nr:radical SAM protein [Hanamia sp.]